MKRSEALSIIDKQYSEYVNDFLSLDLNEIEDFVKLEERILKALETAGMLPPRVYLEKLKTEDNAWEPES